MVADGVAPSVAVAAVDVESPSIAVGCSGSGSALCSAACGIASGAEGSSVAAGAVDIESTYHSVSREDMIEEGGLITLGTVTHEWYKVCSQIPSFFEGDTRPVTTR